MKKQCSCQKLLETRLTASSLFVTYCSAFHSVTGWTLDLVLECPPSQAGQLTIPVPMGQAFPFFLVASSPVLGEEPPPIMKGLLEAFVIQLGDEINRAILSDREDEPALIRQVKEIVKSDLTRRQTLDELAAEVGVCPFHLCRLFKEHTGLTLTEYNGRLRVERARQLLVDPTLQIGEVSEWVGFQSISQFNRTFRKYAGEAPREYRERLCQLENLSLQLG